MVILFLGQLADDTRLVQEVAVNLCPLESSARHLHFDKVALHQILFRNIEFFIRGILLDGLDIRYGSELACVLALPSKRRTVKAGGGRFGSATGQVKQLPEKKHRGVDFARPAASGQDYGLRVARLRLLLPHSFLDDTHQLKLLYNVAVAGQR